MQLWHMLATRILKQPENAGYSLTNKILVGLHECSRHQFYLLIEPSNNITDGATFPGVGKALCAELTHCIFPAKTKLVKLLAMLHTVILKVTVNGGNFSFVSFLCLGLLKVLATLRSFSHPFSSLSKPERKEIWHSPISAILIRDCSSSAYNSSFAHSSSATWSRYAISITLLASLFLDRTRACINK
jgi:hypothetical protein